MTPVPVSGTSRPGSDSGRVGFRRLPYLGFLLGLLLLSATVLMIARFIGVSEEIDQILLRTIGASRGQVAASSLSLGFVIALYILLGIGVDTPAKGSRIAAVVRSAWTDGTIAARELLNGAQSQYGHERWIVTALIAAFTTAFAIFLWKNGHGFIEFDQFWNQIFVDYDIDWGTPVFSLGANALSNFGIQGPLNTNLLPLEALAHAFPLEHRITATVAIGFLAVGGLFVVIGGVIGLKPIPRTIFAGAVALLVTIPRGLDKLIWLLPPDFFTSRFIHAIWWLEAPILFLTTVFLFFWLGQRQTLWRNVVISASFATGCFAVVLSYPYGAIYFVLLTMLYCLGFIITSESRSERAWKAGISALVITVMLFARVPQFLTGLYSYTFGAYFFDRLRDSTPHLIQDGFLLTISIFNIRAEFVFLVSMAALGVAAVMSTKAVRRIAIAALVCEVGIVVVGLINALVFRAPIRLWYAEIAHSPIWGAYFVLLCMVLAIVVDRRLAGLPRHARGKLRKILASAVVRRRAIYLASLVAWMVAYVALQPRPSFLKSITFPPTRPVSLEMVAREVAIIAGHPFRGRLLTLAGMETANDGLWSSLSASQLWQQDLGNDHFIGAPYLNIPTINEFGHWTSPVTFVFLRSFLGQAGDSFTKFYFPLHAFNLRIVRVMGIRMVATDAKEIFGGTLVYETKAGDSNLHVFRIDDINLGQFSPTHVHRVTTAGEAIAELRAADFDPERDVVVEDSIRLGLVPAISASVTVDVGPTLVVQASSPGRSLLVLPFEYSHCLRLSEASTSARLMPVNLQQTGLLFEGSVEARITYRFGLFGDSSCRGDDVRRANGLKLRDAIPPAELPGLGRTPKG
jgi:hypothetical protein